VRRLLTVALTACVLGACSGSNTTVVVRGADEVLVMSPQAVIDARPTDLVIAATSTTTTIPVARDERPAEIKLFETFAKFRSCLSDRGFAIEGDLLDPTNPAFQDPTYVEAVQTCAVRTNIVSVLQEVQTTRSSLTPDEVATRNQVFIALAACLEARGWTIETGRSEIGLIEPTVFESPDGSLNDRDVSQCLAEQNLG
jgi:hypothetical protein